MSNNDQAAMGFAIVVLAIFCFAMALILVTGKARAHSFYPAECCSDRDCWPATMDKGSVEPEPMAMTRGWLLHDGTVIEPGEERRSPDGRFHVCRVGGAKDGPVIRTAGGKACFWVPVPSM